MNLNVKKHLKQGAVLVGTVASMAASSVHAALPTEATAALTSASTAVTDASAGVWPVIGAVLVAGITIKLVKRFANKI